MYADARAGGAGRAVMLQINQICQFALFLVLSGRARLEETVLLETSRSVPFVLILVSATQAHELA